MEEKEKIDLLKNYSEGKTGWRDVVYQLELNDFDELVKILEKYGLEPYQRPESKEEQDNIAAITESFINNIGSE